jgi:predicted ATPase
MVVHMIQSLRLQHFKAFHRFTVNFGPQAFLVGPNSAGKSTIIAALRACSNMIRQARQRTADRSAPESEGGMAAYTFSSEGVELVAENLRHEFRSAETRLELRFKGGARVTAVWPITDDEEDEPEPDPYFVLRSRQGVILRRPSDVRRELPQLTVLALLSPVEHEERVLSPDHVRANWRGRLASRHFRNQLRLLNGRTEEASGTETQLDSFKSWIEPWTPSLTVRALATRIGESGRMVDLYCQEAGSHSERELFWLGDGVQVWLQLLMHLFVVQQHDVVVLDEPDLYLHADLQRRLVRLLETLSCQTIAASHSAEVLVEAAPSAVTWIDKGRSGAVRAPGESILTELSDALGSQFNLRLARALRARAVLFVEGHDLRVLRNLGRTLGAEHLVRETGLVTIPLQGFSNWEHVEPFSWLVGNLLERAVPVLVVLDRDYRTPQQVSDVDERLKTLGVGCHVWHRKELESYLLESTTISRVARASQRWVDETLASLAEAERTTVFARQLAERMKVEVSASRDRVNVTEDHQRDFDQLWAESDRRHHLCNAKDLLSGLNRNLTDASHGQISARLLSSRMLAAEIPEEMARLIERVEEMLDPS